jgi:predicted TIM-barrel fold metal-dependent hydrolase
MNNTGSYKDDILLMRPVGGFIFDCHCHIGAVGTMHVHGDGSEEALIAMMDLAGVDKCAVSHILSISGDVAEGNRLAREAVKKYPDRISQYLVYDPNLKPNFMADEIEKYIESPETVGIKLHPMWHGTVPSDVRYDPAFEIAAAKAMPVLVHTWGTAEVLGLESIARRHPGVPVLIGHSGGAEFTAINTAIRAAAENDNLYLDLTMSICYDGLIEHMLKSVPAEKILFGSDMSYIDPRSLIGRLAFAKISESEKRKIFGENFVRLISRGTGSQR